MKATMMMVTAMVTALSVGTTLAVEAEAFVGNWVNIDTRTEGLTRVDIAVFKSNFSVHAWRACSPSPCDLGTTTTPIPPLPGDTFTAVYELPKATTTLGITLISANSLYVHTRIDSLGGRQDFDDYFCREGSGKPLPDLVVSSLTIPAPVVVSGPGSDAVVTMTIRNLGPGIVPVGTTRAEFRGCTRNGEPFDKDGFFPIASTQPLYPGQTQTYQFSVGNQLLWPVGVYSIRIKADSQEAVEEADERNNLSAKLAFDIAEERFLAGTIRHNGNPLTNYTDLAPLPLTVYDYDIEDFIDRVFFWYDPQTSHYLISGLPNTRVGLSIRFWQSGDVHKPMPNDYWANPKPDLTEITDEQARNYDLNAPKLMHLLEPWDNTEVLTSFNYLPLCQGTEFSWEPVDGTDHYHVLIKIDGSDGTSVVNVNMTETSLRPDLEPLAAGEHYWFMIYTYNASDELLGYTMHAVKNTYGWGFNFQVCPSCVRGDINRDCRVNLLDLTELAESWLMDTR